MAAIADTVRRRLSSRPGSAPADIWVRDRDFRSLGRGSYSLKQVLERLAWFCPTLDGSSVFPKIQTIADALGVTPRAVQYSLRRLEELGFIEVAMEAHQHVPRVYQINVEKILSFPLTETGRRSREKEVFAMRGEPAPKEPDQADEADEPDEPDEADKPETPKTPGVKSTSDDGDKPQIPRGEKYVDQGCKVRTPGVKSTSSPIEEGTLQDKEEGSLARASATGPDDGPDANALEVPLVSQVWRDHSAELEALPSWPLLERCIPDSDDGKILTLAVETPVIGFAVLAFARLGVEAVLGRRIAVRVRFWVNPALHERGIDSTGKPDGSRHRRDGEIVTLDDKAWRLWCDHAAEIEALPHAQSKVLCQCYPDDYAGDRLFVCCASIEHGMVLYDVAGEVLAKVLGERIKPQIFGPLNVVIAARLALAADEQTAAAP